VSYRKDDRAMRPI